jgi:hypothetical protein
MDNPKVWPLMGWPTEAGVQRPRLFEHGKKALQCQILAAHIDHGPSVPPVGGRAQGGAQRLC